MSARRRSGDGESFADAVSDVRPLADRTVRRPDPEPAPPEIRSRAAPRRFIAVGEGSARLADIAAKTLAKLARGEPAPERDVDLHGLDASGARLCLRDALLRARAEGVRCARVIHGRGRHSESGAVLRERVPEWLSEPPLADAVLALVRSGSDRGGSTLVLLRRRERAP